MNKSLVGLKKIIESSANVNTCLTVLNLDINSYFICLLKIIEDSLINYKDSDNYEYLLKVADYLEKTYNKLNQKNKKVYKQQIVFLRQVCKEKMKHLMKKNKMYFNQIYVILGFLLVNKNKEKQEIVVSDFPCDDLYDLLNEIIFEFKNLDYLDKIIKEIPSILNSQKDENLIFPKIIDEYINQVILNNDILVAYYERVINKFLLDENFKITNRLKDKTINDLEILLNKKNIKKDRLLEIKKIIESICFKTSLFELFNINKSNIEENEVILNQPTKERKRINGYIMTVDSLGSEVLDDAISTIKKLPNGNLLYMIHIADPLANMPYWSKTMQDAKKKGYTIYGEKEKIDMLPSELAANKLSLIKGEDRFTKTFCIEFDTNYNIVDYYFYNTIINVKQKLSYDSLNEFHKKGGTTAAEEKVLRYYDDLISSMQKKYKNAKIYEEVKTENIIGNSQKMDSFSEQLISYSMILVGHLVSSYFSDKNLPYAYRCHEFDEKWETYINTFIKNPRLSEYKNSLKSIKNGYSKSYYDRENHGHQGLNLTSYSHITSPLRRYCDVLNMYILDTCYFKRPTDLDFYRLENEIDKTCRYLNMQNNTIEDYLKKLKK